MNISLLTHHKNNTDKLYCSQKVCIVCVSVATPCVLFSAKRGCTVTELIFFIIPHLNYVALVCTGMCMWVLEARREFLGRRQTEEEEGGRCAHLILLSSGAAAFSFLCVFSFFSFLPATVLLHLPFVYFKVRKRGERMVGESHIFSSLRVLLYSP